MVAGGSAPSAPQSAADNPGSTGAIPAPEAAQLLQSLTRELTSLRQDMEQMKAGIAELKASDDLMMREIAKVSDKATDKALEQALRPRVSMVSPPQAQPVAIPARKPPPPGGATCAAETGLRNAASRLRATPVEIAHRAAAAICCRAADESVGTTAAAGIAAGADAVSDGISRFRVAHYTCAPE